MFKVIVKTIAGLGFLVGGFGVFYIYLINANKGSNPLLLILSIGFVITGIILLLLTSQSDETLTEKPEISPGIQVGIVPEKVNLIERNNKITQAWFKNSEKKDKMELLKMVANAEENPYEGKK